MPKYINNRTSNSFEPAGGQLTAAMKALLLLMPVGMANQYVFNDDNVPLYGFVLLISSLFVAKGRLPRTVFPFIACTFTFLLAYAWFRLDPLKESPRLPQGIATGATHVADLVFFFMCFLGGTIAYAKTGRLSLTVWYFILGYIAAFVLRNSTDIEGLQEGANLSPGFVLVSIIPFIFMLPDAKIPKWVPYAVAMTVAFWLALIGARTAFSTILLFLIGLQMWPLITRTKTRFVLAFFAVLFIVLLFHILYLTFATNSVDPLVEGATFGIFEKRIGTRIDIWIHLLYLIVDSPFIGHGTEQATLDVAPLPLLEFTFHRDNLGAHSLYFEILYRLGAWGMLLFLMVTFSIWIYLWKGRDNWTVRVAGVYLATLLLFVTTSEFLMFSAMRLDSAFAWTILGIGVGASLRQSRFSKSLRCSGCARKVRVP